MRTAQQVNAVAQKIEAKIEEARHLLYRLEDTMGAFREDTSVGDVVAGSALEASRILTDLALVAYREAALEQETEEQ